MSTAPTLSYTESQRQRMAAKRAADRDLLIPDVGNPDRRAECEADDRLWLATYCPDVFYNPFTVHQLGIIEQAGNTLQFGTQKCEAAPRGDGKSSILRFLALAYALKRQVSFPLLVGATAGKAKKTLEAIKWRLATRAKVLPVHNGPAVPNLLPEDYPLECLAARYVDPWPSRGRNCTANGGRRIHVEWGAEMVILPTWEDEEPLGPILLSLGWKSDEMQGCNVYGQRPDWVLLDDLDSRDSLAAEDGRIAGKIEEVVDKTVAGLGGQSKGCGQFMLCTITSRRSAAFKYSDPREKPTWSGERVAAITKWPEDRGMWDKYVDLRRQGKAELGEDGQPIDVFGRLAHAMYLESREAMDAGAELSNPHNFDDKILPDGSQQQVSALQRCYDYIADFGLESFQTEHQNDPPAETDEIDSSLTARRVQMQVGGYAQGVVPPGCTVLTQGIDVRKTQLHWVLRAWQDDGSSFVIDYGEDVVSGTTPGTDDGLDNAIVRALIARFEVIEENPAKLLNGEVFPVDLSLIDLGWRTAAVYKACRMLAQMGHAVKPAKGQGDSQGSVKERFRMPTSRTKGRVLGDGWHISRLSTGDRIVSMDADRWKNFEHDRWRTSIGKPGATRLWGEGEQVGRLSVDQAAHEAYARHITAESEVEVIERGARKRKWKTKSNSNHWLDASYMTCVAAAIEGVRLTGSVLRETPAARTLGEMATAAKAEG